MPETVAFLKRMADHGFQTIREWGGDPKQLMMWTMVGNTPLPYESIRNEQLAVDVLPLFGGRAVRIVHQASGECITSYNVPDALFFPFADGTKLDCPIRDCVFRELHDIRTFKIYDQPNLELGRDRDFSEPIGTVRNVYFDKLAFNRAGRFQVAVNVNGLSINGVQLNFDVDTTGKNNPRLVEIGPMSQTYKFDANNPASWVELFSPDRDVTVRGFSLTDVRVKAGDAVKPLQHAEDRWDRLDWASYNSTLPSNT